MNIRHRITMLVVLSFVAICIIGGYALLQSRSNAMAVRSVTEGGVPSTLASADLVSQLKDVQLGTMSLLAESNSNLLAQDKEQLSSSEARLKQSLDAQFRQIESPVQRGLVQEAQDSLNDYFNSIADIVKDKLAGQNELANATFYAGASQYQVNLQQNIDALRIEKSRSMDQAIARLNHNLANTVTTLALVTLVTVLLLSAMGLLLYRQIIRPITRMQAMMSEIAASQDFTRRVPVGQLDEIGKSTLAFNSMIARIQESSTQLKQKTNDIQSMLANIPQGILTIVEGQRIHAEYSACLETLLETPEIAGQDVMALLFSDSNLGADSLSQIETVMAACIGEARMNYDFNAHLLVDELEKRMSDGRVKILDLNWSPICDEHDTVQRLMLCVRDVSELRKLAAETHEQKRELEIIGEILAVSQEKFHEFIAGAMRFIDENQRLISENAASDGEVIAQLFRNMHTVKGNARTYGLKYLTHSVHLAEHSYDELRKPSPTLAWEPQQLLRELADVQSVLERYARINEHSLGRKGPGRRGNIERYLMVDKEIIQQTLQQLETVNTRNLHELIGARDAVHRVLRLLGTEPLAEALSGVIDSLPSLAQELGKDVPIVEVEDNGYLVRNQAGSLLKNVFMHLMRNALDHGLETPDARRALGKPAPGRLRLKMTLQQDQLAIALSDDGRGLALGRIRKQALARGLIAADARLSDEQVAQLIFVAGFSTAERVSEVSGRGVGLDAVQSFVSREQGRIEIRFVDQERGQDFRQFETVVFLPAAIAVPVDHPLPAPVSDAAQLQLTGQA